MSEVLSMVTALTIIVILLISSGSRFLMRKHFDKKLQPHLEALDRASKRNSQVKVNGT